MPNVTILTNSELDSVDGAYGEYNVQILKKPTYVAANCEKCEDAIKVCPEEVLNEYEFGVNKRKAIYKPFPDAYPPEYIIDMENCTKCGLCVDATSPDVINLDAAPEMISDVFGTVIVATGYDPYEPKKGEYGFNKNDNIITLFQLDRMLQHDGPTGGELDLEKDDMNIVFISCVGSMQDPSIEGANTYCSRMCCAASFKNMIKIKEKYPDAHIFFIYQDIRTYARRDERLYEDVSHKGVIFLRHDPKNPPSVFWADNKLAVETFDELIQEQLTIPADMIVLATGMVPPKDIESTRTALKLPCSAEGFLQEAHAKLRPVEVPSPGIYIAGAAQSPRDIIESVTSASASAAKAVIPLTQGEVELEAMIATVDEEVCGHCGICEPVCPYHAISYVTTNGDAEREIARVDNRLCAGCGVCASACPSGAMQQKSFTDDQLYAMIHTLEVIQ
jgi:heterodisulfide reductase subunit A